MEQEQYPGVPLWIQHVIRGGLITLTLGLLAACAYLYVTGH